MATRREILERCAPISSTICYFYSARAIQSCFITVIPYTDSFNIEDS